MKFLGDWDPRDNLSKARRKELELFARANGVTEIVDGMPAVLMRKILRSKGLTRIQPQAPRLGQTGGPPSPHVEPASDEQVEEIDADDDLMRQWKAQRDAPQPKPVAEMKIYELRAECKKRGIFIKRTDKADVLRGKLNGEDAN